MVFTFTFFEVKFLYCTGMVHGKIDQHTFGSDTNVYM